MMEQTEREVEVTAQLLLVQHTIIDQLMAPQVQLVAKQQTFTIQISRFLTRPTFRYLR